MAQAVPALCVTFSVWPFFWIASRDASTRAAERRNGAGCCPSSQPWWGACEVRRPTGAEDSQLRAAARRPDGAGAARGEGGGAVTVGYVAAPAPLLAVPLLAGAAGEAIDGAALSFLLHQSLAVKKEEEERRQKVRESLERLHTKVDAEPAALLGSSSSSAGKRKKRRKRRLPRTSSRPSRQLRRRLPFTCTCSPTSGTTSSAVSRVRRRPLASTAQRQFRTGYCFPPGLLGEGGCIYLDMPEHTCGVAFDATIPKAALDMSEFLDKVVDVLVVMQRQVPQWFRQCCSVEVPHLQFIVKVVVFSVAVSHGLPDHRHSPVVGHGDRCP